MNICGLYGYGDIVGKGVFETRNLSLYAYGALNPLRFFDPDGNYNREAAVEYARTWSTSYPDVFLRNPKYNLSKQNGNLWKDCTNYAFQVLLAGGIKERDNWYNKEGSFIFGKRLDSNYTHSFTTAKGFAKWLAESGVVDSVSAITAENFDKDIKNLIRNGGVDIGDMMAFVGEDGAKHFAVVTKITMCLL